MGGRVLATFVMLEGVSLPGKFFLATQQKPSSVFPILSHFSPLHRVMPNDSPSLFNDLSCFSYPYLG